MLHFSDTDNADLIPPTSHRHSSEANSHRHSSVADSHRHCSEANSHRHCSEANSHRLNESTNQPQLSTFFPPPCKETEKQSSPLYPYLKVKVCLALWWCHLIHRLMFNDLSTFQNFRLFSPKRKVAHIYAILARSVLHIYAVGLYNYAFRPFSGTFSSVRVHTLCWP